MLTKAELLSELEELVRYWRIGTSDDRFDRLQEAHDDTRTDCADELEAVIKKAKNTTLVYWTK